MTIKELCERIHLQPQLWEPVKAFSQEFDFESVRPSLEKLKIRQTGEEALEELYKALEPDEGNIKILACSLKCAAERYEDYKKEGIDEEIFHATMGCFTRFGEECFLRTGMYACDREWWTIRQLAMTIFRLGELEFEMNTENGKKVIQVHIPSDASITAEKCDASIAWAKKFFADHYPEYKEAEYLCDSWLLSPALKSFLPETSNILGFQKRFQVYKVDLENTSFTEWLYRTREYQPEEFPEETSLQRRVKQFVLEGGRVGWAFGKMI